MDSTKDPRTRADVLRIGLEAYWDRLPGLQSTPTDAQMGPSRTYLEYRPHQQPAGFSLPPAELINVWSEQDPPRGCTLGTGHQANVLRKVVRLLGLEVVEVG